MMRTNLIIINVSEKDQTFAYYGILLILIKKNLLPHSLRTSSVRVSEHKNAFKFSCELTPTTVDILLTGSLLII